MKEEGLDIVPDFGKTDSKVVRHVEWRPFAVPIMDKEPSLGFRVEFDMLWHELCPNGMDRLRTVPRDEYLPAM